jgi:hypothetical protein
MPPGQLLREVRYETEAQQAIDDACEIWLRADDQVRLLEWAIVRDPTVGTPLTESGNVRAISAQGAASISSPTVTLVYEIEPSLICIKSALIDAPQKIH